MHHRHRPRSRSFSRPLIAVCLAACLAVLGAYLGGAVALSPSELGSFAVASTVVFSGLAVAYELGY